MIGFVRAGPKKVMIQKKLRNKLEQYGFSFKPGSRHTIIFGLKNEILFILSLKFCTLSESLLGLQVSKIKLSGSNKVRFDFSIANLDRELIILASVETLISTIIRCIFRERQLAFTLSKDSIIIGPLS